jgi:hypothetical protein
MGTSVSPWEAVKKLYQKHVTEQVDEQQIDEVRRCRLTL